jgi:four helix bundle protein
MGQPGKNEKHTSGQMDETRHWKLEEYQIGEELSMVSEPGSERHAQNFKDLRVWQQGRDLVKIVYKISRKFPKDELFGLTSQIRRASVSVTSNIAEGWGRNKTGYFGLGLSYSRGSVHEVESQLINAIDLEFITEADAIPAMDLILRCSSGLLNFIAKLDSKR